MIRDLGVMVLGWGVAQRLFHGYEAHVPWPKRLAKLATLVLVFSVVHTLGGRRAFYGLLGLMTGAIGVLHGYWFQHRHGIHWRTAEPRQRYLALIGQPAPPEPA
jgi:hypothetical protein